MDVGPVEAEAVAAEEQVVEMQYIIPAERLSLAAQEVPPLMVQPEALVLVSSSSHGNGGMQL